jgi:hypothetical protein
LEKQVTTPNKEVQFYEYQFVPVKNHCQTTYEIQRARVYKFSKNLGATSKILGGGWVTGNKFHTKSTQKYYAPPSKI